MRLRWGGRSSGNGERTPPVIAIGGVIAVVGLLVLALPGLRDSWSMPMLAVASVVLAGMVLAYALDRRRIRVRGAMLERQFRVLLDHAPDTLFVHDAHGRLHDVNRTAVEHLGYSRAELLTMSIFDIERGLDRGTVLEIWKTLEPDRCVTLRGRHRRKDGSEFPIEVRVSRCDAESRILYLATIRDLTADLETRRMFEYRESVLSRASRLAKVGGWGFDVATGIGSWTDEVAYLHDLAPTANVDINGIMHCYVGDGRKPLLDSMKRIIETGEPYDLEVDLLTDKGNRRRMHTVAEAVMDNGKVVRVQGVCQDVTERWEADQKIRVLLERLTLAAKAARIGIWDLDCVSGRIVCTEELFDLMGYRVDGSPGWEEEWIKHVHPDDRERVIETRHAANASGNGYAHEYRTVVPGDGSVRHLKSEAMIFRDDEGKPLRTLGCLIDVTSYHQALEEREQAKVRAEEANATKSRFLAVMSHELRTPLNAIIGFSELMQMSQLGEKERESAAIIADAGKKLLQIIEDILDLSKIEAGRIRIQHADFDLHAELDGVLAQFRDEAEAKGLSLVLDPVADLPQRVGGDAGLLRVVLANLIGNAVKFTMRGNITVTAERGAVLPADHALELVFHVVDTGIGIRPENQSRIFSMFEQEEDNMTRRFGGTGIGLTISKELVTLMGGRIWMESEPGQGARFSFSVRFENVAADAVEPVASPSPRPVESDAPGTVLVVEDDIFSRTLMMRLLEQNGFHAKATGDGGAAVDWLKLERFDAVLLDIQLPTMNGIDVARRIRSGGIPGCRADLPIVAISAYASPADRARYAEEGFNSFIAKPVDLLIVLSTLRRFLAPAAPPDALAGAPALAALHAAKPSRRWTRLAAPDL